VEVGEGAAARLVMVQGKKGRGWSRKEYGSRSMGQAVDQR
jgi:hypothetical protein